MLKTLQPLAEEYTNCCTSFLGSPSFRYTQNSQRNISFCSFQKIAFWSSWKDAHELLHCTSWVLFVVCCSITEKQSSIAKCHLWNLLSTFALLHVGLLLLDSCRVCSPLLEACEGLWNKYYALCLEGCNCIME